MYNIKKELGEIQGKSAWPGIHYMFSLTNGAHSVTYFCIFSGYILGRDNLEETIQITDVEPGSDGNSKNGGSVYLPFYTFSFS
jgi:hypothetical protein